jgi:ribonuclease PH
MSREPSPPSARGQSRVVIEEELFFSPFSTARQTAGADSASLKESQAINTFLLSVILNSNLFYIVSKNFLGVSCFLILLKINQQT